MTLWERVDARFCERIDFSLSHLGTYKPDDAVTMNDDPDDGSWDVLED